MNKGVKKSIMYLSGEDFYLFCYAILITLDSLKCTNGKYFKDYRKLAFIIEFLKDGDLNSILLRPMEKGLNPVDRDYLFHSYSSGLGRRSEILKLLFMLEKKNLVILEKSNVKSLVNVSLNKANMPDDFLDKKIFSKEYNNVEAFKKAIKRLSALKLETMLDQIYGSRGVSTWAI